MKNNQILIVVGVIALVLIIANWNKIFGATKKRGGGGRMPTNDVVSSQKVTSRVLPKNSQLLTNLQNGTKPSSGQRQVVGTCVSCWYPCGELLGGETKYCKGCQNVYGKCLPSGTE